MYTTKTTLINKLANGCEIGWTDFEHTYRPLILSVAAKQGVPHSECDDILQLVMLALFNNGTFNYSREKHGKFRTYLGGALAKTDPRSSCLQNTTLPHDPSADCIIRFLNTA